MNDQHDRDSRDDRDNGSNRSSRGGGGADSKSSAIHYRRCHVCSAVTEAQSGIVKRCEACGKAMAPFFFFEEAQTPIVSEFELRPPFRVGQHPPVRGLTAYW